MCLVSAFIVSGSLAYAEESQDKNSIFDLSVGIEGMEGDTTYQIGGNIVLPDGTSGAIHFPVSELEWPLDIWLGRIDAGLNIGYLQLSLGLTGTIHQGKTPIFHDEQ